MLGRIEDLSWTESDQLESAEAVSRLGGPRFKRPVRSALGAGKCRASEIAAMRVPAAWLAAPVAPATVTPPTAVIGRRALVQLVPLLGLVPPALAEETEIERRDRLKKEIDKRGGLDVERRGQFNEKALFSEDFYYKYGLRPTPAEVENLPEIPFSPIKRRYEGYQKYAARITEGISAYAALPGLITAGDWGAVSAALEKGSRSKGDANKAVPPSPLRSSARAMGLICNSLLQSENEATTSANLLARHCVNEYYFALDDIASAADASDAAAARVAWERGLGYLNAYVRLINRPINERVGEPIPGINVRS